MALEGLPGLDTMEAPEDLEGLNLTVGTDLPIVVALEDQEDQWLPDQDQASILHPLTATCHLEVRSGCDCFRLLLVQYIFYGFFINGHFI